VSVAVTIGEARQSFRESIARMAEWGRSSRGRARRVFKI
jgi:hypothetical protein